MLALKLTNGKRNIIHMIFGPQTQFQFDMIGFIYLDLTTLIESYDDSTLPIGIVITRCEDEIATFQAISHSVDDQKTNESGVIFTDDHYMDMIGKISDEHSSFFMGDNDEEDEDEEDDIEDDDIEEEDTHKIRANVDDKRQTINNASKLFDVKATITKGDLRGVYLSNCQCALCRNMGVYARKGLPVMCADCLKIEFGLHKLQHDTDTGISIKERMEFDAYLTDQIGKKEKKTVSGDSSGTLEKDGSVSPGRGRKGPSKSE